MSVRRRRRPRRRNPSQAGNRGTDPAGGEVLRERREQERLGGATFGPVDVWRIAHARVRAGTCPWGRAAIRVPRAMFIRKAFGCSPPVLHANTSLVVVAGAGHALLPEEPQVVADALLE